MNMLETINFFVDTMIDAEGRFAEFQNQVTRIEEEAKVLLQQMERETKKVIQNLSQEDRLSQDKDIVAIFDSVQMQISDSISSTAKTVTEAINGMTFIKTFESQFTVSVFGKVKAGKSYIGNLIMGGTVREAGLSSSYDHIPPVTVHVYDRGNESSRNSLAVLPEDGTLSEFAVGMTETTSSIQWFRIGGLVWIDTPGIGSVTWQNELLAQEYVKNSDLIIYACNSDAAGTTQDFQELDTLLGMGKPVVLLLTMSDTVDEDEDENGDIISVLVPKSEKDRLDQENYMRQSLFEKGLNDALRYTDMMSVSAMLANEALKKQDEVLYEQSNIGNLLEALVKITNQDAVHMKQQTPKSRLNEMLDRICEQLSDMSQGIQRECAKIEKQQHALEERRPMFLEEAKASIRERVEIMLDKMSSTVEKGENKGGIAEEMIIEELTTIVNETLDKICQSELNLAERSTIGLNFQGIGSLQMKQESIAYKTQRVVSQQRDPRGLFEKIGSKVFKKTYYRDRVITETHYSTFDVGLNAAEVKGRILRQIDELFRSELDAFLSNLVNGYYQPIQDLNAQIRSIIENTTTALKGKRLT